jgi:DNA-binding response OmpR family regulator
VSAILVIEDEPAAGLLREFLAMKGFEVLVVDGAQAALHALRYKVPDAVVLDPFHLGTGESEFLRCLRLEASFRPLPLVVLRPAGISPRISPALAAAAAAVVSQPIDMSRLVSTLRYLLAPGDGRRQGRSDLRVATAAFPT